MGGWAANGRPLKVKLISPAKTAADSVYWRSIKYSLFPPLGLATLAGYLEEDDEITLQDEHVEKLRLDDEPDLVVIEAYITSAHRAYRYADHYRAKGAYVCLGGLHPTSLPEEAARHADSVFCGPGEDTWPAFLKDFRAGHPKPLYRSTVRTLAGMPRPRRDLIKRERYLVPNSLVVSRGCPHVCDFCYKEAFFKGGRSFYVQAVDDALAEIERLPGRHLYFLDDNLFGSPPFAEALFDGLKGMGRLWQAAGTVQGVLQPGLLEKAVESGLRSLFIGFETLSADNLRGAGKTQNLAGASGGAADGGDVPHHDAVPGDAAGAPAGRRGPRHHPRLGSLRHPPCGVPPGGHGRCRARGRLLERLPGLLPLEQHLEGDVHARRPARAREAPRLHRRLEEARADVGPGDPRRPGAPLPSAARDDPRPLRQRRRGHAGPAPPAGPLTAQAKGRASSGAVAPCFLISLRHWRLAMKR